MRSRFFLIFLMLLVNLGTAVADQLTPEAALKRLVEGNARFVQDIAEHPERTSERREQLIGNQAPIVAVVSCSDSRVPPEILFDQGLGDIFAVRIAGNVIGPIELDSVEYAAKILNAPLIFVLGHQNCGAVQAVLAGTPYTEVINSISPLIKPLAATARAMPGDPLENLIKLNVQNVVKGLQNIPLLRELIQQNKLRIVGGYYHLGSGKVELLQP